MANKQKQSNPKYNQMAVLKRVLRELKPRMPLLILSLALAVLTVALTLFLPILTGQAVDLIIGPGEWDFGGVLTLVQRGLVVVAATGVLQYLMNLCNNHLTYCIVQSLRAQAIRTIEKLPLSYLDGHTSGELVSRVIADADQFGDGLLMGFTQLFSGVITIIGTLGFMLSQNVGITLVVVCLDPLSLVVAGCLASRTYSMFPLQRQPAESRPLSLTR